MDFLQRKYLRLKGYDYSAAGGYFVTICTQNRKRVLSSISIRDNIPVLTLTQYGQEAEKQIFALKDRYNYISVDNYIIMPDHIHMLLLFSGAEKNRVPLTNIICAYKSVTTRACKAKGFSGSLFQRSFFEHVVRNTNDYSEIHRYISTNPIRWINAGKQ